MLIEDDYLKRRLLILCIGSLSYRTATFNTVISHLNIYIASLLFLNARLFCVLIYSFMLDIKYALDFCPFSFHF